MAKISHTSIFPLNQWLRGKILPKWFLMNQKTLYDTQEGNVAYGNRSSPFTYKLIVKTCLTNYADKY